MVWRKDMAKYCLILTHSQPATMWMIKLENLSGVSESDTNQVVQPQKMARGFSKQRDWTIYVAKNKGADQLHGYRTADLYLCFRISKMQVFS